MKLCHFEERIKCSRFSDAKDQKIEIIKIKKNDSVQFYSELSLMFLVIDGSLNLFCNKVHNKKIHTDELIFIPLNRPSVITALEDLSMLVMHFDSNIIISNRLQLNEFIKKLNLDENEDKNSIGLLKANQKLIDFSVTIQDYLNDDINCCYYFDIKIREFIFLIQAGYDKKQIFNFFSSVYKKDFVFISNIYNNLDTLTTVKEMSEALNYSQSGFFKKFKRIFQMSPYQWILEQKARKVYRDIYCSKKTFTEMAFEYGFSSPAHFNDFCKTYFNNTPGGLRKESNKVLNT